MWIKEIKKFFECIVNFEIVKIVFIFLKRRKIYGGKCFFNFLIMMESVFNLNVYPRKYFNPISNHAHNIFRLEFPISFSLWKSFMSLARLYRVEYEIQCRLLSQLVQGIYDVSAVYVHIIWTRTQSLGEINLTGNFIPSKVFHHRKFFSFLINFLSYFMVNCKSPFPPPQLSIFGEIF